MVQYEKVNGVPKLVRKGAAASTSQSGGKYVDKDGNVKDVKDLPNYLALVNELSKNGAAMPTIETGTVYVKPPVRKPMNVYVSMAYPYINYHARYMRECAQMASQWLVERLLRQKDLMRGISAYKNHVNGQEGEVKPA